MAHKVQVVSHGQFTHSLFVDGRLLVDRESFTVVQRIADALCGNAPESGECLEVAESIRKWLGDNEPCVQVLS